MSSTPRPKGGTVVTLADLSQVPIPQKTETYTPLPHIEADQFVRDHAEAILTPHGFQFVKADYRSYRGGDVAIGRQAYEFTMPGMYLSVDWMNSYNKMISFTMTTALMVKVCSNGMHLPVAAIVRSRMHTSGILNDINPLIIDAIQTAPNVYETGVKLAQKWNLDPVPDHQAHDVILQARRRDIIGPSMIEPVLQNWIHPPHEEFVPGTRWCLYNAFTEAMKGLGPDKTINAHRELTKMFTEA